MEKALRGYVNDYCIKCGACIDAAPRCLTMRAGKVVVTRQPETRSLFFDLREAQALCPVNAIVIDVWEVDRRTKPRNTA